MSIAIEAIWEHGVLTPKTRLDLPEKTSLYITIDEPISSSGLEADDEATGWNNLMELAGCLDDKDGATDVSRNHDKYLYGGK